MTIRAPLAVLCLSLFATSAATAAVSPDQAARLGKDLTPLGAEMAGNADGSIPPWDPKGTPVPAGFVPGSDNYTDPYADEKPLYTIDGGNWKEHADTLSAGSQALFAKFAADGFRMNELAQMLGVPAGTVKSRLHSAKQRLRTSMKKDI